MVLTPEKQEIFEDGEEAEAEPSQFSCPAYVELLEVIERKLPFDHNPPVQVRLSFVHDLHTEIKKK